MELISIIVPVYNVEKYLKRCIESILGQNYSKLQIILVDDGSTDRSGKICDSYAEKDSRIEVIHKENGGLSDARNIGIEHAKGTYITFVDSDDMIDRQYISFLFSEISKFDADISICRYKRFTESQELKHLEKSEESVVYNNIEALKTLLYTPEKIPQSACGKLYKIKMFKDIRYPLGRLNEDIGTTYKLFYNSKKIVYNSSQYYFYYQRMDGIVRSRFSEKSMDAIYFSEEILAFVQKYIPDLVKAAQCYAFAQNIQILIKIPLNNSMYDVYKNEITNAF